MVISHRLAAMVLAGAAAFGGVTRAEATKDWPQFHGPARDNISKETGLLKQWPAAGPALAWSSHDLGAGFSSVAVANGKIFTAGEEGDDSFVIALNEADGKQAWKSNLGKSAKPGGYAGPRATPTVDGESVYTIGQLGDVVCMGASDGKEVWRKNLNKDFGGRMMSGWGNSESLLVDGDNLICTPGGKNGTVLALNKKTGEPVWRSKEFTDNAAYASPFVVEIGGARQVIILTDQSVAGVSAKDGALLWQAKRPGKTAVIPTPVVKDNYVYVTSGYGVGCDLFKVNGTGGKFTAEAVYTDNKSMVDHHGGVILLGDYVYGHSDQGGWTCQELLTGKVKWNESKKLGKGTIAYADGHFYLRSEDPKKSTIALIEATPDGWKESGRFEQPEHSGKHAWPHLVIANGKLYVRDQGLLLCYDVKGK